jgi:hypothetical protein
LATKGQSTDLNIEVARGAGITGPIQVELIVPQHMRGISSSPAIIPAGISATVMQLRFAANELGPFNMPLTVRATATVNGHPYLAESKVFLAAAE